LQRIAEDHLRILRFFRFSARFADVLDAEGLAACTARANDLMALSRERIAGEMRGLLKVPDPAPVLAVMIEHGILKPVLPEITAARLPVLARTLAAEAATGTPPDWRRRLAALLPPDAAVGEAVGRRLRLANADRIRIATAVVPHDGSPILAAAWTIGAEAVADRLLIAGDDGPDVAAILDWARPKLPVSGRDLLARGLSPGPQVAARLLDFERAWVAAGFPVDPATITAILDRAANT
jgi:poly(A) polymerase